MARERNIPWKVKLGAPVLAAFASSSCFGGGNDHKATPSPGNETATALSRQTQNAGTVLPTETRAAVPTSTFTSTPTATREPSPTAVPTPTRTPLPTIVSGENFAAHFGGGLSNWIEVPDSTQFHNLTEFTILARVKIGGLPPDAIIAKGDTIEAFALFATLPFSCPGGEMTLVVDNTGFCSSLKVPRGRYVNVGVTFKNGGARFFVDDQQSLEVVVDKKVSEEKGPLFIGSSPRGLNEGFSGEIDNIAIIGQALTPDDVRTSFALLQSQNVNQFIAKNGQTLAIWTFDGKNELNDLSGNGSNGKAHGQVSLVAVN